MRTSGTDVHVDSKTDPEGQDIFEVRIIDIGKTAWIESKIS